MLGNYLVIKSPENGMVVVRLSPLSRRRMTPNRQTQRSQLDWGRRFRMVLSKTVVPRFPRSFAWKSSSACHRVRKRLSRECRKGHLQFPGKKSRKWGNCVSVKVTVIYCEVISPCPEHQGNFACS